MGVLDWLRRAAAVVRRCKPRVKPVTEVCRKGFDVSRAAKAQVDGAVKTKAREIHDYFWDDQARDHLSRLLKHFSKNGALFIVRSYGGGPILDIFSQSLQDRKSDSQMERLEELELKLAKLEWELRSRGTIGQEEISRTYIASKYHNRHSFNSDLNQKPHEALQIFLMKNSAIKILDDLMVPHATSRRKLKSISGKIVNRNNKTV